MTGNARERQGRLKKKKVCKRTGMKKMLNNCVPKQRKQQQTEKEL